MKKIFYLLVVLSNLHWCMAQVNYNTFKGASAGGSTTSGAYNSFFGYYSGMFNTTGNYNDFFGTNSGQANSGGTTNLFIGFQSGSLQTNSQNSTYVGSRTANQSYQFGNGNTGAGHSTGAADFYGNSGNVSFGRSSGAGRPLVNRLSIRSDNSQYELLYGEFDNRRVAINGNAANGTLDVKGNIQLSNTNYPMGLMMEVGGYSPVLNLSLNFREANVNTANSGAAFRVDVRNGYPAFQWLTRPGGSTTESVISELTPSGNFAAAGSISAGTLTTGLIAAKTNSAIRIGYDPLVIGTNQLSGIVVEPFQCNGCGNGNDINFKRVMINTVTHGVMGTVFSVSGAMHIRSRNSPTGAPFKVGNSGYLKDFLLWVEKGIISQEFVIAAPTTWSDYVFKEDYELTSLNKVEQYIEQNGHLPNIPSQEEIKENGYTFHDMDKRFLEKIEELTLYKIQQEKQLQQLNELAIATGLKPE